MPNYFYKNNSVPEWQLLDLAEERDMSLEDFLKSMPGITIGEEEEEEEDTGTFTSASDFYNINKKDDEVFDSGLPLELEEEEEDDDFSIASLTKIQPTRVDVTSVYQQPIFDEEKVMKAREKAEEEASLLKKWLNEEYFGKDEALNAMEGSITLSGYEKNDKDMDKLREDFKSKLGRQANLFGEIEGGRTIFPNLSDDALDGVLMEVIDSRKRKEETEEQSADVKIGLNDILSKKDPTQEDVHSIAEGVDKLDWGVINSNSNNAEAQYAKITKLLKGELDSKTRKKYEDALDKDILGSIGDLVFNKDEMKYNSELRAMVKTGKRIPKEREHKVYHNVEDGVNVRVGKRDAIPSMGVDITDPYELYLSKFKNTSLDDLTKFNSQHLLEKSGYGIEGEEIGDYYVGDKGVAHGLEFKGYKRERGEDFIFKNVKLKDIMSLSHKTHGFINFLMPDIEGAKGDIIPQDFKNKPYKNEQEFLEYLRVRRNQGNDIAAKDAALWETYYLNRDPSTLTENRFTQFLGTFSEQLVGEEFTEENLPTWNKKIIETFDKQIRYQSGVDVGGDPGKEEVDKQTGLVMKEQQADIFERTLSDDFIEGGAGISAILVTLHPIQKIDKAFKITQGILGAGRWVGMTGKSIKNSEAIRRTAMHNKAIVKGGGAIKSVEQWAAGAGYNFKKVSGWRKGMGIAGFALYEDFKLKEVLGTITDGRMEFKRGVGAGFSMGPRLLPFGFGRFAKGKNYNLSVGSKMFGNRTNAFLQSTLVNGPSFALAVESGDLLGAAVDHYYGREEMKTWFDRHWSDRDENMKRIGMNIFWGKALGMKNFNWKDLKTTQGVKDFMFDSVIKYSEDVQAIEVQAKRHSVSPDQWIMENLDHKLVKNRDKHYEDWQMAQQRLDLINQTQKWVGNAAEVGDTYKEFYKPLVDKFKEKGKKIRIIATDAPVYQKIWVNGREVKQEVDALYTKMADAKDGIAKIEINTRRSKGKETAIHESGHAYVDLMDIKVKTEVADSFRKALESIKTEGNSNLWKDIVETYDIREEDKLEEMLTYSIQYMSRKENYNSLTSNKAWKRLKTFWNNFAESTLGKKADLNLKQDILDLMGTIAETGKLDKIELLNEMINYDPVSEVAGTQKGTVASKSDINKTIKGIQESKAKVLEEINNLRSVGPGYDDLIEEKTKLYNELNSNQTKLENQIKLDAVDVAKQSDIKSQIDKNYTIGKYKDITVNGKKITAKEQFQTEQQRSLKPVSEDIRKSTGLENMIRQSATLMGVKDAAKPKFIEDVKEEIIERFLKNYDPGKVNKKFGRALTPFEYLTTRPKGGESIIYRAAGDVAGKYKKQIKTVEADAFEGGYEAFEGYSEQTGHMNTARTFDSRVEREGVELSESPGMQKVVGTKKVKGKKVNVTLGERIDQKSGADAKNLDFTATGAKEVVSYKNIKPNAEKTIGKDVVVEYYGVKSEMHKKMEIRDDQQLNNEDIESIQDVVKSEITDHLKTMPLWKQSIIDKYTGREVAFDVVGGKFPSEPKATGTTTKLLKNPLLYKEIPQTGTKGSKYEWSDRLKEFYETADPAVKTKFEQDVLESWGMGETLWSDMFTRAEVSGIYKGIMTQRKKAMYVQGVDKALPNTPELLKNFILAQMANQVTAGKSPGIAATEINQLVTKLIRQKGDKSWGYMVREFEGYQELENAVEVLKELQMREGNMTRDVDIVKANERAEREHRGISEKEMQEQTIIAERIIKNVAEKLKLNLDYSDPKWVSEFDAEWREVYERQVYEEFGYNLTKMDALKTHRKRQTVPGVMSALWMEFGGANRSRMTHYVSGEKAYLKKEGNAGENIENILGIKTGGKGKDISWMEKVFVPDGDAVKRKEAKIEGEMLNEVKPDGTLYTHKEIADAKIEMFREEGSYTGKSKDYEATIEANTRFARELAIAKLKVAIKNKGKRKDGKGSGLEWLLQDRAIQTNARYGVTKALFYNIRSIAGIGSGPGEMTAYNAKGKEVIKDNKGVRVHWEHALQLLNNTQFLLGIAKRHKLFSKKAEKELEALIEASQQDLIPKNAQLFNDTAGNTMFSKEFGSKHGANTTNDALLNVFTSANKYAKLENQYIVGGENKGKTLLEVEFETYDVNAAKKILASIPKKNWNLLEYMLDGKVKSDKGVEIQNREILSKSLGSKIAKTVASKDVNKLTKAIDKALANGRKRKKETKGGSFWDLDDTVARTKSGVRYTLPNPSGKPQPGRKVIFMAGGPGSGKSTVIKGLDLKNQGFKIVNQDISLQWLANNHGLPTDMRDFTPEQASKWGELGWDARMIAKRKQSKFQGKGDGIIVDGTGNSLQTMQNHVQEFKNKGYDVQMVFVETSLETALQRNRARKERSLRDVIVKRTHESVQNNKEAFRKLFGDNFAEIKTDNLKQGDPMPSDVIGKVDGFTKGYIKGRLDAGEYAHKGADLEAKGAEFDFAEFDIVKEGEKGPLFDKAMDRAKKFGTKDTYILTARPHAAQMPIFRFLEAQGLKIPFENIITLENSTPEAKALEIVKKIGEGYNDIYFADDAMQNVKAVKNVMEQFDVKGKVQHALAAKDINKTINNIMEHSLGIVSGKRFSKAEAYSRGKDIKRRRVIMPDSNADMELLIEPLLGKGKQGIENKKWFEKNFYKPWERGINDLNTARQTILNDYKNLRKQNKDVVKSLQEAVEGTTFTNDQAARVYIWNKNGFKIPGLAKTTEAKLVEHVKNNPKLQVFAENVSVLTKIETGLKKPGEAWMAQTLASEISKTGRTINRQKYIGDWIEIKNEVFSKENLNKMESKLGTRWRESIEDMFDRMETGRTRSLKTGRIASNIMDYFNGAVGATMHFNTRSGVLQSISTVNFLNFSDNNVLAAGKAFANQPQYWKDFMHIMNSDMLVERRQGLKINVNEAELAQVAAEGKNRYERTLAWVLKQGFIPTKVVDSFAIAAGGATFYRNRIKTYEKQGFKTKEAEKKAWLDFQSTAEKTQQSSRADLLGMQQTSIAGKLILPFANTPIQMNRIMLKDILDISKGRYDGYFGEESLTHKLSRITYYGTVQSVIFATLQSGLFALMTNRDDDDDFDDAIANKKIRTVNTVTDSFLRGMGIQGAVVAGFKNAVLEFMHQQGKGNRADYTEVVEDLLNISPTVGIKVSALDAVGNTYKWNRKEIHEKGFSLDNTKGIEAAAQTIQAITNWPIHRVVRKTENIQGALNEQNAAWQRFWMFGGWSAWDVGVETGKKKKKKKKKRKRRPTIYLP